MNWAKENIIALSLGGLGLLLVLFGVFQFVIHSDKAQSDPTFDSIPAPSEAASVGEIVVDVEGAVLNPGVYKLSSTARTVDALAAAGGLSEDADREYVQKNINLAQKVTDGLKLYIPRSGEQVLSASSASGSGPVININQASESQLEALPGIGAVTAGKIISGRPYGSVDDLLNQKIVGSKVFSEIKDQLSAN